MADRHPLLEDRITVRARGADIAFGDLPDVMLHDAYVEEVTTYFADYTPPQDQDQAFVNLQAIATELRRRDKGKADRFIEETHETMLVVCPELDLRHLTCH